MTRKLAAGDEVQLFIDGDPTTRIGHVMDVDGYAYVWWWCIEAQEAFEEEANADGVFESPKHPTRTAVRR